MATARQALWWVQKASTLPLLRGNAVDADALPHHLPPPSPPLPSPSDGEGDSWSAWWDWS